MIFINDIDDPRVSMYRNLKEIKDSHLNSGLFVAEGRKVALQLLESNIEIVSVFALEEFYRDHSGLINSRGIDENMMYAAGRETMNSVVGFRIHSGIMILAKEPQPKALEELGNRIVVMNGIIDSENVGAIIRNCAAFGIDSVIADPSTSSPYLRRAVRVSMGTVFFTKIHYPADILSTLDLLRNSYGYRITGAEITDTSIPLYDYTFPARFALVFGAESQGIAPGVINKCDDLVHIPINPVVNSINVAASSAVILNQCARDTGLTF